jgi:chromosome segregation ATPase
MTKETTRDRLDRLSRERTEIERELAALPETESAAVAVALRAGESPYRVGQPPAQIREKEKRLRARLETLPREIKALEAIAAEEHAEYARAEVERRSKQAKDLSAAVNAGRERSLALLRQLSDVWAETVDAAEALGRLGYETENSNLLVTEELRQAWKDTARFPIRPFPSDFRIWIELVAKELDPTRTANPMNVDTVSSGPGPRQPGGFGRPVLHSLDGLM